MEAITQRGHGFAKTAAFEFITDCIVDIVTDEALMIQTTVNIAVIP